jgi:capsular polysaccharide biosynthesis protein
MNDSSFTTHGDEPVEARIVSWVLGEASAFEAAELERLCEERPELMVFKRRMLALHGLLAEAETARPDDNKWKLPPEKRQSLDAIFGEEKPIRLEVEKEKRIRHNGRRALLAIAACVAISFVVMRLQPWKQTSEAIIEVKPRQAGMSPLGGDMSESSGRVTPQFFATEFEKIKSRKSLEKVAKNLDLPKRWEMDKEQAVANLKNSIRTENVPGTDLLKIQVRRSDKKEADEITREVAYAYKDYREQLERRDAERALAELNKAVRDQEDKVEERRKVLATIVRNKSIVYKSDGSLAMNNDGREEAIKRGLDAQDYVDVKREFETDQQLLQTMKLKQMGETISRKASSDSVVIHEVPEINSAKAKTQALASNSPRTQRLETELPKELIEGTPKPMNVPNLEAPASGPAGSATWSMAARSRQGGEADERGAEPASPTASPAPSAAPPERHGADLVQRESRPRITTESSQPVADSATASDAETLADEGGSTSSLAARLETKTDSEALSFNSGGMMPAEEPISGGNRDESGPIERENIASNRINDADSAKKEPPVANAIEAPADMLELGRLFLEEDKSDHSLRSDDNDSNGMLSGTNTYSGDMAASGGALGISGSGGGFAASAPEGQSAASGKVGGNASDRFNRALNPEGQKSGVEITLNQKITKDEAVNAKADPKPDLTEQMEEIPAVEEPYSTFSLNISDASFQIAQAALAKGERPDPAGIKVEQFYNAVDYGDPAPAAGQPVSCNIEQAAHPVIPSRNLVRIALKTAAAGRSAAQPLRLTLLVDQSGSMTRADRRAAMDTALAGLSNLLTKNDLVTVIGFSRTPRLLADGMTGDKAGKLAELVNQAASECGTNLEEAIKLGEQLADRRKLATAQNRIVLFTDGAANLGNADPARLAEQVKQLRQKGIAFDIAGIAADGLNDELLGELARNGNGRYYVVGKGGDDNFAKQLAGAFRPAAENVKVQVRFNPERVLRYKLIGFEKDRLKTEDFRNDKVDAAELAAEEAGVAIYQVESNPEGNGELGEVSVRFRDTASGEMVERGWTIPHDTAAPAIDRATPSMQLAVLSMFAGEKLKGGPLGEAIDLKLLSAPVAEVKQFYGSIGRVGEMLRMVDALK